MRIAALALVALTSCTAIWPRSLDINPAIDCVVPVETDILRVLVTEETRKACVSKARLLEREVPDLTDRALRLGPGPLAIGPDDVTYCRFKTGFKRIGSVKFHCMRTDSANRFYDEDSRLVSDAVDFDDEGKLLDRTGQKVRDDDGNSIDGDELHVKYFVGAEPAPRHREMFTETVVGRLFWALGIPVDRVHMPESVRCFGCSDHPFVQKARIQSDTAVAFQLASVKRALEGRKISTPRRDGFLDLGGRYDHGWSFREIGHYAKSSPERRLEAEVHALALNIVAYSNFHSIQNDLRCAAGAWNREDGRCEDAVAYVSDIGGTLGGRSAVIPEGDDRQVMKSYPRGDFITFSAGSVFADTATCKLQYPIDDVEHVSDPAIRFLAERIQGRLTRDRLLIIFEAAGIHRLESHVNELIARRLELDPGPKLDRAVQMAWADELHRRLQQIVAARCP